MKSSIFLTLLLATISFAAETGTEEKKEYAMQQQGKSGAVGAAYFLTNEPTGNFIVTADIANDGTLSLFKAVSAGGAGGRADQGGPPGPDPLFSQGAVKASKSGEVLVAVNPGSSTLSLFKIDAEHPSVIKPIGFPISSGGEFPVTVDFNAAGDSVCVLNTGEVNTVSCFSIDKENGLAHIAGSNRVVGISQTTPPVGPPGTAGHVLFTEDGKHLVAAVKGVPTDVVGFLAIWDVNEDGSLSEEFRRVEPQEGGLLPFSMTNIPGRNALLVSDPAIGYSIFDLNALDGAEDRSSSVAIEGQGLSCWSVYSPGTGNFYLTDSGTSEIYEIDIEEDLSSSFVAEYAQGPGSVLLDIDIATIGGMDYAYTLRPNVTIINVLALNGPGSITTLQELDIGAPAQSVGLPLSGDNLVGMTTFVI